MERANPQKSQNMQDREFSIEDGYQIFVFFMPEFWWNFLKGVMLERGVIIERMKSEDLEKTSENEKTKDVFYDANYFVFITLPSSPSGCDEYIEKIIEKNFHIPPSKQHQGLRIEEEKLFQLVVDFCLYFKRQFKEESKGFPENSLDFAIQWLEDMKKHPDLHTIEWNMWNEAIADVTERGQRSSSFF